MKKRFSRFCIFVVVVLVLGACARLRNSSDNEDVTTQEKTWETEEKTTKEETTTEADTTEEEKEITEAEVTEETEDIKATEEVTDNNTVSPEFKDTMDTYEEFFDEYIAFMQKYMNAGADDLLSMMNDYNKYLSKYSETMNKMDSINEDELTNADRLYYIEVTSRINEKLLKVAVTQ